MLLSQSSLRIVAVLAFLLLTSSAGDSGDGFPNECQKIDSHGDIVHVADCKSSFIGASTDYINGSSTTEPSTTVSDFTSSPANMSESIPSRSSINVSSSSATTPGPLTSTTLVTDKLVTPASNASVSTADALLNASLPLNGTKAAVPASNVTVPKQNTGPKMTIGRNSSSSANILNSTVSTPASVPSPVTSMKMPNGTKSTGQSASSSPLLALNIFSLVVLVFFSTFIL